MHEVVKAGHSVDLNEQIVNSIHESWQKPECKRHVPSCVLQIALQLEHFDGVLFSKI